MHREMEIMSEILAHLWPQFGLLLAPGFHSEELGVWIWIIMAGVFGLSVVCLALHYIRFRRRLKRIHQLFLQAQGEGEQEGESIPDRQNKVMQEARSLWQVYEASLVYSADKSRRYSTLAAEYFFNGRSLARGLTSSRLLAAAPAFLTALGVLGTFIGLTVGLRALQVDAAEIDTIKLGVSAMINGAAVAFMTSVWGVLSSLVLNLIEKIVERDALRAIAGLQQEVDQHYPHYPAERSLVKIADATDESKDALQHLHERIGERLQEAVTGMSESMQEAVSKALNEVMAPAVQTLVRNASQQSTEVLENLVTRFMDSMKTAGSEQGQFMKLAAEELQSSTKGITERLETLFQSLDEKLTGAREHTEHTAREFSRLLTEQRDESVQQQREVVQQFGSLAERFSTQAEAQLERSAEEDRQRTQALSEVHQQMAGSMAEQLVRFNAGTTEQIQALSQAGQAQQDQLSEVFGNSLTRLQALIEGQVQAASEREQQQSEHFRGLADGLAEGQQQLLSALADGARQSRQQMQEMAERHQQLLTELSSVADSAQASSQHMNSSSTQLGLLASNLREVTETFAGGMTQVSQNLEKVMAQSGGLVEQMAGQMALIERLQQGLAETTESLGQSARKAEEGFHHLSRHQQSFLEEVRREFEGLGQSLARQVESVEQQAEEWLKAYSREVQDQVNQRMQEWNGATLKFADGMQGVVTAMAGIVDDIEARV